MSEYLYALSEMSRLYDSEQHDTFGIPSRILQDAGTELVKTYKTETFPGMVIMYTHKNWKQDGFFSVQHILIISS
jgi:hypothetical protein